MKLRNYIFIGVMTYLCFVIINIPAAPVLYWLNDQQSAIRFQNVSGSVWKGRAGKATINSREHIQQLEWSWRPTSLLTASIGLDFHLRYTNEMEGTFHIWPTGTVELRSLKGSISATKFQELANIPFGELAGEIRLDIDSLTLGSDDIPSARGKLEWNNAKLTLAETVKLGNILLSLNEGDNPINGQLSNKSGDLELDGTLELNDMGDYSLELNMKPSAGASSGLKKTLNTFTTKKADGGFVFNNKGNLKEAGII